MNTHKVRQVVELRRQAGCYIELIVIMEDGSMWSFIPDGQQKKWARIEMPTPESIA